MAIGEHHENYQYFISVCSIITTSGNRVIRRVAWPDHNSTGAVWRAVLMGQPATHTPPAGYRFLTPLYDIGVRISTRETLWRNELVELISPRDKDVVFDIGSGTGSLVPVLAKKSTAMKYFGIDPDKDAVEIARKKALKTGSHVRFKNAMFSARMVAEWPAPSVVTLCLVLHQVPLEEKRRLLEEIYAVIAPGGRLFVTDYGEQKTWLMRKLFRATVQQLDGVADTQPNADGVLMPLMAEAGFTEVRELRQFKTVTGSISIICGQKNEGSEAISSGH